MELKQQPVKESDYWDIIEGLGGFIWSTNHGMRHGHIEDKDGEIKKELLEARQIQERLLSEISEKFGIISPNDYPKVKDGQTFPPAPEGKIYYWDWYKKMKESCYLREYEGVICSACPFSEGLQEMIDHGGSIPCGVFSGVINRLFVPHQCAMLSSKSWSKERLYKEIMEKSSPDALLLFQNKEKELRGESKKN